LFLVILCILFEMNAKYRTYCSFSVKPRQNQSSYSTWNQERGVWEKIELHHLREGQIIKVERYFEQDPRLNPTNLLPIAYASRSRYVSTHAEASSSRPPASISARSTRRSSSCAPSTTW
jgi:hypothetical protein